jgi:diacylglycerol kinase family enzyme
MELVSLGRRAAGSRADRVVAGGGDGTVAAVASAIMGSDKALGVLPFGTMNHFAKDLGIPLDLEGAVATIVANRAVSVDVGEVDGRIFLNNSSLGLYPRIIHAREQQQRLGWGKWPAYLWAAIGVLRRYPFLEFRLNIDGHESIAHTPFVFVGNNAYDVERFTIGSRACLDKGELSLYTTRHVGRLGLAALALRGLVGGLRQDTDLLGFATKDLWIGSRRRHLRVALDGEVSIMQPPLHYRIRPAALNVLAPDDTKHGPARPRGPVPER